MFLTTTEVCFEFFFLSIGARIEAKVSQITEKPQILSFTQPGRRVEQQQRKNPLQTAHSTVFSF